MASYELLKTLDRGGMAEVFLARLVGVQGFEKRVVLKRVLPHLARDRRFIERFFDEARTAAQLAHPNVVQIFELGEERGNYFIAMEYVEGKNLKEVCRVLGRHRRVPIEHAVRIVSQVLDGLEHAHSRRGPDGKPLGIVHRDVSPSNIIVTWDGGVKLIDFGIAKTLDRLERTSPGAIIGKAGFMSPEQCRGEPVDGRSDLFAAGSVLYRLLTGDIAFPGRSEVEVVQAVARGEVTPPLEKRPDLPGGLAKVLEKALAPAKEDRYASAREMQIDLERVLVEERLFSSPGLVAEYLTSLFAEERIAELPSRDAGPGDGETKSRIVTIVASMPSEDPSADGPPTEDEEVAHDAEAFEGHTQSATVLLAAVEDDGPRPLAPTVRMKAGPRRAAVAVAAAGGLCLAAAGLWASREVDVEPAREVISDEAPQEAEPDVAPHPAPPASEPTGRPGPEGARATAPDDEPAPAVKRSEASRRRRSRPAPVAAAPRGTGTVDVAALPWAEVYVDGKKRGVTPLVDLRLPAGEHVLVLVNPEQRLKKRVKVNVAPNSDQRIAVRLDE